MPVKVEKINISRVKRHVASFNFACIMRCISSLESHGRLGITRSGTKSKNGFCRSTPLLQALTTA